jgi:hypothetical protein
MARSKSPRPLASGTGVNDPDLACVRVGSDYRSSFETWKATYWLHVARDGTEHKFSEPPSGIPSLRVDLIKCGRKLIEETGTSDLEGAIGAALTFTPRIPPGRGWAIFDSSKSRSTVWRRRGRRTGGAWWHR